MNYYVLCVRPYSYNYFEIFSTKEDAIAYIERRNPQDGYCILVEGTEISYETR